MEQEITALFADVRGFTPLAERVSPGQLRDMLNVLFVAASELLIESDALIDKLLGDAIMAVFNAPIPQSRHRQIALGAAIALQREIAGLNVPFAIGIGLNSGLAITGNVGGGEVTDYTAIGDTVNVASRLSDLAEKGEILAGLGTYSGQSNWLPVGYACEQVSLQVKGKEHPVDAYRIYPTRTTNAIR